MVVSELSLGDYANDSKQVVFVSPLFLGVFLGVFVLIEAWTFSIKCLTIW